VKVRLAAAILCRRARTSSASELKAKLDAAGVEAGTLREKRELEAKVGALGGVHRGLAYPDCEDLDHHAGLLRRQGAKARTALDTAAKVLLEGMGEVSCVFYDFCYATFTFFVRKCEKLGHFTM
jgi:hypothetical protein